MSIIVRAWDDAETGEGYDPDPNEPWTYEEQEIENDYVIVTGGTCTYQVVGVEDNGATHILRITGRADR